MRKIFALTLLLALMCACPPGGAAAQNSPLATLEKDVDIAAVAEAVIQEAAQSAGLLAAHGSPAWMIEADKGSADVLVEFPIGPLPDLGAAEFGLIACARLVQTSAEFKTPARRLGVTVTSPLPDGRVRVYGTAVYNARLGAMAWENSGLNLDAGAAPKIPAQKRTARQNARPAPQIAPQTPPQAALVAPQTRQMRKSPAPQEKFIEEEVIVEENAPQAEKQPARREGRRMMRYPQDVVPGAMGPKAMTPPPPHKPGPKPAPIPGAPGSLATPPPPCMQGPDAVAPCRPAEKRPPVGPRGRLQPRGPQPGANPPQAQPRQIAPAPAQGQTQLLQDAALVQSLLNDAAALASLQQPFGNPTFTILGDAAQANILVQFNKGPLPQNAAMNYGVMACEMLARSGVAADPAMRALTLTVAGLLPDGGMAIYGTAFFNGNFDQLAWQSANLQIPAAQPQPDAAQKPARRPLDLRPGVSGMGDHPEEAVAPEQPAPQKRPMTRAERREAKRQARAAQRAEAAREAQGADGPQAAPAAPAAPEKDATRPAQPDGAKKRALDDANGANQASYSYPVKAVANAVVRALGLQSTYGMPENMVIGGDKQAKILLLFKRGPMPDASAASLGLMACEQLARVYIGKGLGTKSLSVTVAYTMEDGRRYDYGTAIFNGNFDELAWVVADRII